MRITPEMVLFWRTADVYSNWHPSIFTVNGVTYSNAEQYMMSEKAVLFNDMVVNAKIMQASDPLSMKNLGKEVRGYTDELWFANREKVMFFGVLHKFEQNPPMYQQLLSTGNRLIVEASPVDRIWGIGLDESDPRALDPTKWRGQNLLGIALMKARTHFQEEEAAKLTQDLF